ncbi:MAG: site-specific DNA-methyltransferase [Lactococcus lactis]|nr:DNA methyltransferase [Leuconostoc sp.]MDN5445970.1 site-specific DNA-methyltransferase [Lactococcus lactis]MDN5464804.1 site-specific DNA-methyltransferase [Lactococcus lactis]MDN5474375.1 site-specific DNA-methyltransferase [Lactococcus lactis]MDN5994302.1 site-specific DNA-methyltransferase [Lactococcus lactis]MDN6011426.1 site-specific DNA-methyltransferase [Lactococcus lactis]
MAKIEPKIFDELKTALVSFGDKYFVAEELNRSKLTDDLRNYDEALLSKLFEVDFIKQHFIKEVAGQKLFQIEQLEEAVLYNDYWDTSYTKYENRVGLASKGKFLQDSQDVVLDFPFKDGVLTASMTKEDNEDGYDDAFLNEVIEKDEIDRLFDKKVFVNVKRFGDNQTAQHSTEVDNGIVSFDEEKDNLIIKGNNLLALHTLADKYAGQIKLIYIDPPYNTGSDSFAYNDKFNHSAWLTFMKNRLEIAKELLSSDGMIFVQTDDKEHAYLKVLMDSIFENKYLNTVVIKAKASSGASGGGEDKKLKKNVEFILVYANSEAQINIQQKPFPLTEYIQERKDEGKTFAYTNVLVNEGTLEKIGETVDGRGEKIELFDVRGYETKSVSALAREEGISIDDVYLKYLDKIYTTENAQTSIRDRVRNAVEDEGYTIARYVPVSGKNKGKLTDVGFIGGTKRLVSFLSATTYIEDGVAYKTEKAGTLWEDISWSSIKSEGGVEFPSGKKPEKLLQRIIASATSKNDIVLDFFMGSGSTQATALKMGRRFIGLEQMDSQIEKATTRIGNVISGEQTGISKDVNWQGGGSFVYAELFPKNMGYLQDVIHAKDLEELKSVYDRMLAGTDTDEPADISFRADLSKIDWLQGFDENKRLLVKLLDKNGLYYNYSEIDDKNVRDLISDEDYTFNKNFYEGGD